MSWNKTPIACRCGSGEDRYDLEDACGYFVEFVCDSCIDTVKAKYRPEVFTDSNYWSDEPKEYED